MTDQTQQHLALQWAVASVLAEARTVADAGPRVLAAIGAALDLDVGMLWMPDEGSDPPLLDVIATWSRDPDRPSTFLTASAHRRFERAAGVPGRVWDTGLPVHVEDTASSRWFARRAVAAEDGIVSGFAVPILRDTTVLGVMEFYARTPRPEDARFLDSMRSVGRQIGQFVERARAEQAVRDSDAHKSAIFEAALDCIITVDHRGVVREFNPAAERTFGYGREDVIGRELGDLIVPEHLREAHREGFARYQLTGVPHVLGRRIEIEAMRADGSLFPVELTVVRVDIGGHPSFTAYLRDISSQVGYERQLREAEERYRTLVERLPAIVYVAEAGAAGRWQYVSPQIETILGFTVEEWLADRGLWARQLHPEDRDSVVADDEATLARPPGQTIVSEYRILTKRGETVWLRDEMVAIPVPDGRPTQVRGVMVDITERKGLEQRLTQHAFYDTLTGLPNRVLFMERLEHALARQGRARAGLLALMFLDVDDFKVINDTLGHAAGDEVLAAIGERLAGVARRIDTPARFGGDEFTLLLEDLDGQGDVVAIAERLAERFVEPFRVGEHELTLTASLGIAIAADSRTSAEELVRHADIAMYRAKENGKSRYEIYHERLSVAAWKRLELEGELRRAIDRDELRVYFQPIVELATGRVSGVEALVRWDHPERGLLPPSEFIPFAEANGLIVPIDRFVLTESCRQLVAWDADLGDRLTVSVNLSAREFRAPGIVETISDVLATTGLDAARLKVEITESVTLLDSDVTDAILAGLGRLGVGLVIDDFGVGYSGLDYVKRFAVDALKIDRSFVAGLGREREDTAIVSATIAFARALGLSVTAEGIETEEQLGLLLELGCESGQGYLFSRPVSARVMRGRIAKRGAA